MTEFIRVPRRERLPGEPAFVPAPSHKPHKQGDVGMYGFQKPIIPPTVDLTRAPLESVVDALLGQGEDLLESAKRPQPSVKNVKRMLDELFPLRVSLAENQQRREAALLRRVPDSLKEQAVADLEEIEDSAIQCEKAAGSLEDQIRSDCKILGVPVQGMHLQTTYERGKHHWDHDRLLKIAEQNPEVQACHTYGENVVKILVRTQRQRRSGLLTDIHTS